MAGDARDATLRTVMEQVRAAASTPKCHRCGCFQETVAADHAAYLGQELEDSLKTGAPYVQDRAPGDVTAEMRIADCGCGEACGNIPAGGGQVAR